MGRGKSRLVAFLLSAFVMPGSGQVYLGRKTLGRSIIAVTLFIVFCPVVIFMFDVERQMSALPTDDITAMMSSVYAVSAALEHQKGTLAAFTIALLIVWALNLVEIILTKDKKEPHKLKTQ